MSSCPCREREEKKLTLAECCGPLLSGKKQAQTAEQLMRSRYTAYVEKNLDYVEATQLKKGKDDFDKNAALEWAEQSEWKGLEIVKTQKGQESDHDGVVEFRAHYKVKGHEQEINHHEVSYFKKLEGKWKYDYGNIIGAGPVKRDAPKVGRNDPCPCGSGKKHKKCCGA
jgi:SEC-C motif-containing protein